MNHCSLSDLVHDLDAINIIFSINIKRYKKRWLQPCFSSLFSLLMAASCYKYGRAYCIKTEFIITPAILGFQLSSSGTICHLEKTWMLTISTLGGWLPSYTCLLPTLSLEHEMRVYRENIDFWYVFLEEKKKSPRSTVTWISTMELTQSQHNKYSDVAVILLLVLCGFTLMDVVDGIVSIDTNLL